MSGFSLIWIAKLFSHVFKILNYGGYQRFDWIKLIHWYRFVNTGWLADIDLFDWMIWLV